MRNHFVLPMLLVGLLAVPWLQAQPEATDLDLYLAIGQSNMAGRAEIRDQDTSSIDGAFLYSGSVDHLWVPLTNPLNRYSTIRKVKEMQRLSPSFSFAQAMREAKPDRQLGMIVNAKGGTKIVQWLPGTVFFEEAIERTRKALKYGRLKGIIWCQGESDNDSLRTSMYLQRLEILINAFREEFDDPGLPFVCSQIFEKENNQAFNQMITVVPDFISQSGLASTRGLSTSDNVHFDSESIIELGRRFASEMNRLMHDLSK